MLLIPLLYRDHLPAVHWKDIVVGPAPLPSPAPIALARPNSSSTASFVTTRPIFRLNPVTGALPAQSAVGVITDAPPALSLDTGAGGGTRMLGNFIPNIVALPPPNPLVEAHTPPAAPIPVGGDVQMAKLLRKVTPVYPPIAITARISGVVRLIGTIGKDGTIQNLQIVSGHPILAQAALEAVRQWIYKPTLLNGNPVQVIAPIQVSFTLGP